MKKILLLHGALGSSKNFDTLIPFLQNIFEVHTITFEGHGGKTIPNHDFTIARFSDEVLDYLKQNKIDKIAIFGYSMGGYVGLYLAKHFPEKVEKLYTLGTKLNWTADGSQKEAAMLNPTIIKDKVPNFALNLEQLHGENWEKLMQKTAQLMLDLGNNPTLNEADFEQIKIPVLISVGDKDAMVTIDETEKVFEKMSNATLYIMPNTIHPIEKIDVKELSYQLGKF